MGKAKKISIPKSVKNLRWTPKKFAKKSGIRLSGKGMSKKEKKRNLKRLNKEYAEFAVDGLNKAVKILAMHPDAKNIDKVKDGVDNVITNADAMKRIPKIYKKAPDAYENLIYLPSMIMNTIAYYKSDNISDEEKKVAETLDADGLIVFCEKILKKQIKRYKGFGFDDVDAFQMASTIPTSKLFKNHVWYRRLTQAMYDIAAEREVDVDLVLKSVCKIDKKNQIKKKEFLEGFYTEFISMRSSNRNTKFTDHQKELQESLIDHALAYLDSLKPRKLKEILKTYIRRRKRAEQMKSDSKRVLKFTEHANSNSPYGTIKAVVVELIADDPDNELYLG